MKRPGIQEFFTLYFGWPRALPVKYKLIIRYWDKASPRLQEQFAAFLKDAEIEMTRLFTEELKKPPSRIFEKIAKEPPWVGGTFVVPPEKL